MRMQFLDDVTANDPAWAEPVFSVQRALEHSTFLADRFFEPRDFLHRGKVLRSGRPDIFLFQHFYTRRYINLDASGHAYRYLPPKRDARPEYLGQYRPHSDLRHAVDNLGLWEMPWMKPGLEEYRQGLPWSERYQLQNLDTGDLCLVPQTWDMYEW